MLQPGHDTQRGGGEVVRLIVPLNPLVLDRMIWDLAVEPAGTVWFVGFAEIVKSGVPPEETTLKATLTEWERPPLFPYAVMLPALPGPPAFIVRVAVAVELGARLTLDGLISHVVQ